MLRQLYAILRHKPLAFDHPTAVNQALVRESVRLTSETTEFLRTYNADPATDAPGLEGFFAELTGGNP